MTNKKINIEGVPETMLQTMYARAKESQKKMVSEYLEAHKGAVVVNIACGMDTRCYRMEGKFARWYNIDLADTIAIREKFMEEKRTFNLSIC